MRDTRSVTPEALYAGGGVALVGGGAVAVCSGVVIVRVSRNILGLPGGLPATTGLLAFAILLGCSFALGILGGTLVTTLSHRTPATTPARVRAGVKPPGATRPSADRRHARPGALACVLACAGPFFVGSLLAVLLGMAAGAVQPAAATWTIAVLHALITAAMCGIGAWASAARVFS